MSEIEDRTRRPFSVDDACQLLARTPAVLDIMLRGLPDPWINANEGFETWSPFDVVGHLVHGEEADWIPRARIILEQGEARPFDPYDRLAQFTLSKGKTLADRLDRFAALRSANVAQLRAWQLPAPDLDRTGTHPAFGVVTLRQLLATWVAHDFDHVVQVARVLANQYGDAVGPWRAYLRVISGQQG